MQIIPWSLILQVLLAKVCPVLAPWLCQADAMDNGWASVQGVDHQFPHNRKSPGSSEPKEVLLVSGTPHPLHCPDLCPGCSDSTFGPRSPAAAGVSRPRWPPAWLMLLPDSILPVTTPAPWIVLLHWAQPHSLLPVLLAKDFSQPTMLILVGQREVTARSAKKKSQCWSHCCWERHTLHLVWNPKTLWNSIGYSGQRGKKKSKAIMYNFHLLSCLGKH